MAPSALTWPSPLSSAQRRSAPTRPRVCSTWTEPRSATTSSAEYGRSIPCQRPFAFHSLVSFSGRRSAEAPFRACCIFDLLAESLALSVDVVVALAELRAGALRQLGGRQHDHRRRLGALRHGELRHYTILGSQIKHSGILDYRHSEFQPPNRLVLGSALLISDPRLV